MENLGILILCEGYCICFKWYCGCCQCDDIFFIVVWIVEGLCFGVSVEVDINCYCDYGFVVLYNKMFEIEMNGIGVLCEMVLEVLC